MIRIINETGKVADTRVIDVSTGAEISASITRIVITIEAGKPCASIELFGDMPALDVVAPRSQAHAASMISSTELGL